MGSLCKHQDPSGAREALPMSVLEAGFHRLPAQRPAQDFANLIQQPVGKHAGPPSLGHGLCMSQLQSCWMARCGPLGSRAKAAVALADGAALAPPPPPLIFYPCPQPSQPCLFCHFNETIWLTEGSDGWQGVRVGGSMWLGTQQRRERAVSFPLLWQGC